MDYMDILHNHILPSTLFHEFRFFKHRIMQSLYDFLQLHDISIDNLGNTGHNQLRNIAKFLLEVTIIHLNSYRLLKHKAGVIITTYHDKPIDWGVVTGAALREGIHTFQTGKKLRPIIKQYFTILFPPTALPTPGAPRPSPTRHPRSQILFQSFCTTLLLIIIYEFHIVMRFPTSNIRCY